MGISSLKGYVSEHAINLTITEILVEIETAEVYQVLLPCYQLGKYRFSTSSIQRGNSKGLAKHFYDPGACLQRMKGKNKEQINNFKSLPYKLLFEIFIFPP